MSEGQRERDWSIASTIMALVANCHRSSKTKPFKPADFNPTITRVVPKLNQEQFREWAKKYFRK